MSPVLSGRDELAAGLLDERVDWAAPFEVVGADDAQLALLEQQGRPPRTAARKMPL